jgi:acetyl-CoA hydrolase
MPRTLGDSFIHFSRITAAFESNRPLCETSIGDGDPTAQRIGEHIAELIPDGATLQLGIGAIPDAVLHSLRHKHHLGIHSELFSDGVIDLVEAGVIDGEAKTLHRGKLVAGFVLGTRRLFDWVHNNAMVELHPTEYVNDPFVIAQHRRMVAINSALQVDLQGRIDHHHPAVLGDDEGVVDVLGGVQFDHGVVMHPVEQPPRTQYEAGHQLAAVQRLSSPSITPPSTRSITPSENSSEWMPR